MGSKEQQGQRHWWGPCGPGRGPRWSGSLALGTNSPLPSPAGAAPLSLPPNPQGCAGSSLRCGQVLAQQKGRGARKGQSGVHGPAPYESSPRISFTKAAMSVFLVLCNVKNGCSWWEKRRQSPWVRVPKAPPAHVLLLPRIPVPAWQTPTHPSRTSLFRKPSLLETA